MSEKLKFFAHFLAYINNLQYLCGVKGNETKKKGGSYASSSSTKL